MRIVIPRVTESHTDVDSILVENVLLVPWTIHPHRHNRLSRETTAGAGRDVLCCPGIAVTSAYQPGT